MATDPYNSYILQRAQHSLFLFQEVGFDQIHVPQHKADNQLVQSE